MRYSLRTLIVVMLLGGPLCALAWSRWTAYCELRALEEAQLKAPAPQLFIVTDALVSVKLAPKRQHTPDPNRFPMNPMEASDSIPMHN